MCSSRRRPQIVALLAAALMAAVCGAGDADGFNSVMPTLNLSDDEIDDVVAYIESLGNTG